MSIYKNGAWGQSGFFEKTLPEGYKQLEYIQSSGTEYIITDYIHQVIDTIEITLMPLEANVDKAVFGSFANGYQNELGYIGGTFRGNVGSAGPSYNINTKYTLVCKGSMWYLNNVSFGSAVNSNATIPAYIFARNYGTDIKRSASRIYNISIYREGNLIYNYVPSYKISDDAVGLYDTVNNVFYENQGTGTLIAGPQLSNKDNITRIHKETNVLEANSFIEI